MTNRQPHPHFDDKGSLDWHTSLNEALKDARAQGKRVFIELGREVCTNCKAFTEIVVPMVAPLLDESCVALAADADEVEDEVDELALKLDDEPLELPIVMIVDASGQFLGGKCGRVEHFMVKELLEETKIAAD